jgi:hypothetical protein
VIDTGGSNNNNNNNVHALNYGCDTDLEQCQDDALHLSQFITPRGMSGRRDTAWDWGADH